MRYFFKLIGLSILIFVYCDYNPQESKIKQVVTDEELPKPKIKLSETCEWGEREAKKDYAQGKLMLIRWNLEVDNASPYWKILSDKYHIYVKDEVGCVVNPAIRCCNEFMEKRLLEKHGKSLFMKVNREFELLVG